MDNIICPICGHTLVVKENKRVSCPYCENFHPDSHWANLKEDKRETTDRKTTSFFKSIVR